MQSFVFFPLILLTGRMRSLAFATAWRAYLVSDSQHTEHVLKKSNGAFCLFVPLAKKELQSRGPRVLREADNESRTSLNYAKYLQNISLNSFPLLCKLQ